MGTVSQQKAKKEIKKVDRLGRAVVSFIFSFIGLASLGLFHMAMEANKSYNTNGNGIMVTMALVLLINATSFFLGMSARRSTSGRGLAIAAITISSIPLALMLLLIIGTMLAMFLMN